MLSEWSHDGTSCWRLNVQINSNNIFTYETMYLHTNLSKWYNYMRYLNDRMMEQHIGTYVYKCIHIIYLHMKWYFYIHMYYNKIFKYFNKIYNKTDNKIYYLTWNDIFTYICTITKYLHILSEWSHDGTACWHLFKKIY